MDYMEKLKIWNTIKESVNKIYDPKAKKLYYETLLLKAIEEWGFNPEKPVKIKQPTVKLEKWEQGILDKIKTAQEYGINTQTMKEKDKLDSEFRLEMLKFIKEGGDLADIPEHIHCESIKKTYKDYKNKRHQEFMELANYAINL